VAPIAFVLLGFAAVTLARSNFEYQMEFTRWMQTNSKSYHHDEFRRRFEVYKSNLDWIDAHNAEGHSYSVKMNHLGDLTNEEYRTFYLGLKNLPSAKSSDENTFDVNQLSDLPSSLDWRDKGVVTGVKNQEQCGSCWSFSTTGSMEGCIALTTSKLVSFSEQNLVDCSGGSYGNEGCNGGLMTSAMDYIIANGGLDTEDSYPYTAKDGTCKYDSKNNGGTLKSYKNVPKGNETALQYAVNNGPVSIAIDASSMSFQFYSSGIYSPKSCSSTDLDHGVLAVGWGVDSSNDQYWIVKNSWGTTWGQQGYIWMPKNKNNFCGVATMATLPVC